MSKVLLNYRNLNSPFSGVQRYTKELMSRLASKIDTISTRNTGIRGHLWEQTILPFKVGERMLWSPANTGPVLVRNQTVTIHDLSIYESNEGFSPLFIEGYKILLPKLAHASKTILTDSEYSKSRIIELLNIREDKVFAIPLGVDSKFVQQSEYRIEQVIQNLNIPTHQFVLSLGSLEPRKNLKRLFESWSRIVDEISEDIWLVVAGEVGNAKIFKELDLRDVPKRVYFTGRVKDEVLPSLYSAALFLVYPSIYEGFGLPPLEAMACGTPSITGNLSSLPEVIGDSGIMVNPHNIDEISDAILCLINTSTLRNELSEKGLIRVQSFNWDTTATNTWNVLNRSQ